MITPTTHRKLDGTWQRALKRLRKVFKDAKIVLEKLIGITEKGSAVNGKAKELLEKL